MLNNFSLSQIKLLEGILLERQKINYSYLMKLQNDNLLQAYYFEAGLLNPRDYNYKGKLHGGWEAIHSPIRGHFLGHFLSAASMLYQSMKDPEIKVKVDKIVQGLRKCQMENGGEWVSPFPEKYLYWLKEGKRVGAPHYVVHKLIQGLYDAYRYAENRLALVILDKYADWFVRYCEDIDDKLMDQILDEETGGMLETWSYLYIETGDEKYKRLIYKYTRRQLFDKLLNGQDVLTNMHMNTTVPEAIGMAIAYEATGDEYFRDAVMAYWEIAVDRRNSFCTGGQSSGEIWTPPGVIASRLGSKTQEHCCVYNMCKLANILFTWTGDIKYANYIELNIYNGMLAQQNPKTGTPAYFLPLGPGSQKEWGSETEDFWCCHGTIVEAHSSIQKYIYYGIDDSIYICQYFSSELEGNDYIIKQIVDKQTGNIGSVTVYDSGLVNRPYSKKVRFNIKCKAPKKLEIKLRVPDWISDKPIVTVNGQRVETNASPSSWISLNREWDNDEIVLELPYTIKGVNLPDEPNLYAFMLGPIVLAGIIDKERELEFDGKDFIELFRPYDERHWSEWRDEFITRGQKENIKFMPLYKIFDETYTVYFPIKRI